jgi:hypothetical protein
MLTYALRRFLLKVLNKRTAFPEFIRDYMITKYGLKSIALTNLDSLIKTSLKHAQTDVRVQLFGMISGILLVPAVPERQFVAPQVPQSSAPVRGGGSERQISEINTPSWLTLLTSGWDEHLCDFALAALQLVIRVPVCYSVYSLY